MEEVVREQLKLAELKREELKKSLNALSAQSSSLLEVSVRLNVVDSYFESVVKMIERKRDEAVREIRVREDALEKRVKEIKAREEQFEGLRKRGFGEMLEKEIGLDEWEKEVWKREKRVKEVEEELEKRREELRLREERVEVLRSGIFGEIYKKNMELGEREMRISLVENRVEEMERGVEMRTMRMEEERTKFEKVVDDWNKMMEWRGKRLDHRKKLIDAKVKEVEAKELSLEEEKNAVERRAAKLETKENDLEKMKKALNYLVEELEVERSEKNALQEKVALLTQKLESAAKSSGSSDKSREEESVGNQFDEAEVPSTTKSATTLDGRTLQMYVNKMASNDDSWQYEVHTILQKIMDPAKVVLDAMEGFYPPHISIDGIQFDAGTVRKTCICLLRKLNSLSPVVRPELRDEALKLAYEWKEKMTVTEKEPLEVTGFLELVMAYNLTNEFNGFELLHLSKIAYAESAPLKLLQDLGCANSISPSESSPYEVNSESTDTKAADIAYAKNLIHENQRLEALEYIYEFDLEDYFPISTMVEVHVNYLKQNSRKLWEEGGNSAAAQKKAAEFEITALRDLIKCIEDNRFQARYSPSGLYEWITQLERQYCSKKRPSPWPISNPRIISRTKLQSVEN